MGNRSILPPCSYQGGKQRVSNQIIDYIFNTVLFDKNTKFFDLCSGSGAITLELISRGINPQNITMLDISSWGTFWKSIGEGTFIYEKFLAYADEVPRDKAKIQEHIKTLSKENANTDECYKYILLQASSFGGKQIWNENGEWKNTSFRNYWQPTATSKRRSPVNPMQPMIDVLCERVKIISKKCIGIQCINDDIYSVLDFIPKENCVIYIDPPYSNTTKYGFDFKLNDFLSELFNKTLSPIFVSEKEKISDEAIRLNFNGAKGGISGNRKCKNEEWLNVFR